MAKPDHARADTADPERERNLLARKWAYLLSGVTVVSLSREGLEAELRGLLDAFCANLLDGSADTAPAEGIGARLVSLGYVGEPGLRCTLEVLGKGLPSLAELRPPDRFAERIVLGLGALSCGFLIAHERSVLDQQEIMHLSLLKAVRDAQWNLKESEARFDEVVTTSASGIAVVGLDGRIVRANTALAEMLGRPSRRADRDRALRPRAPGLRQGPPGGPADAGRGRQPGPGPAVAAAVAQGRRRRAHHAHGLAAAGRR